VNLETLQCLIAPLIKDTCFEGNTYFAGGCVRDYVMTLQKSNKLDSCLCEKNINNTDKVLSNSILGDVDICVHLPNGGIKLAKHLYHILNGTNLVEYPSFGTASFLYKDLHLEFVATRKEIYRKSNRYPKVEFGSLKDDVLRRDFTINALLMDISKGNIMDLCGLGLQDLKNGIIRSLGKPEIKFAEDPIRMLRAVRFSLRFGFNIEATTWKALASESKNLSSLSGKLIKLETEKMLNNCSKKELEEMFDKLGWSMWFFDD